MNARDIVRPVGNNIINPDQWVVPVVVYPASAIGDGTVDDWSAGTVLTGQITVATAGTAVQGTSTAGARVAVKAHPDNTDTAWVGNDGADDVTNANGFPLNPGEGIVLPGNLNQYWFDTDVSGEKICWSLVE